MTRHVSILALGLVLGGCSGTQVVTDSHGNDWEQVNFVTGLNANVSVVLNSNGEVVALFERGSTLEQLSPWAGAAGHALAGRYIGKGLERGGSGDTTNTTNVESNAQSHADASAQSDADLANFTWVKVHGGGK